MLSITRLQFRNRVINVDSGNVTRAEMALVADVGFIGFLLSHSFRQVGEGGSGPISGD
jgi:hypothetical protein